MIIGFTGTREGMTHVQKVLVEKILKKYKPTGIVHGDCKGADDEFHEIYVRYCKDLGKMKMGDWNIVLRPCDMNSMRAWCTNAVRIWTPRPPLVRNKDIVDTVDMVVACPKEPEEIVRSGTWSTIRYARRIKRPLIVVKPEKLIEMDNMEKFKV